MDVHGLIERCQQIIVNALDNGSPENTMVFVKHRIDETNIAKVEELSQSLSDVERDHVMKALSFMKRGLTEICETHSEWALGVGRHYGRQYQVSSIDQPSLALEGLYKAAIRFVPRGSFRSYATSWIRQCIQRSVDHHIYYTLDSPIQGDATQTHIEHICVDDIIWGESKFYHHDPYMLEDLRVKYCDHLTLADVERMVNDKNLAEAYGC